MKLRIHDRFLSDLRWDEQEPFSIGLTTQAGRSSIIYRFIVDGARMKSVVQAEGPVTRHPHKRGFILNAAEVEVETFSDDRLGKINRSGGNIKFTPASVAESAVRELSSMKHEVAKQIGSTETLKYNKASKTKTEIK